MERFKIDVTTDDGRIITREVIEDREKAEMKYVNTLTQTAEEVFTSLPYKFVFTAMYRFGENEWELLRKDIVVL